MMETPTETHIALVGIGRWGQRILDALAPLVDSVACVSSGGAENIQNIKNRYPNIEVYENYQNVLNDTSISAVVIATPIATHAALARDALNAGKHVFVEKPLSISAQQGEELLALADKRNLSLFTGYIYLYHPVFEYIKKQISGGVDSVISSWNKFGTFHEDILWNLFSHDLSVALSLFDDEPETITLQKAYEIGKRIHVVDIRAAFPAGRSASFSINRIAPKKYKLIQIMQGNTIFSWHGDELYVLSGEEEYKKENTETSMSPLERELEVFLENMEFPKGEIIRENKRVSIAVTKRIENLQHQMAMNGTL